MDCPSLCRQHKPGQFTTYMLSFFAEIGKAQALGRLVLTLFPHTGDNQHQYGDNIGERLKQLLTGKTNTGNIATGYI